MCWEASLHSLRFRHYLFSGHFLPKGPAPRLSQRLPGCKCLVQGTLLCSGVLQVLCWRAPTYLGGRQKRALSPRQSTEGTRRCVGRFKAARGVSHHRGRNRSQISGPRSVLYRERHANGSWRDTGWRERSTSTRGLGRDLSFVKTVSPPVTRVWVTILKASGKGETQFATSCLSSQARERDTGGSRFCQEPPPPRTTSEGLHGTYTPCLSTCLSHSEPWENARPQNSHGKRFSVLTAAPRSENLKRSVRRKQACYLWAGGAEEKSVFTRRPLSFPASLLFLLRAFTTGLFLETLENCSQALAIPTSLHLPTVSVTKNPSLS